MLNLKAATLVGEHPSIQQIRQLVEKYARWDLPVLISGETGTGKSLVARLLHRGRPYPRGEFVAVNCPAVPAALFEAEVFGSRRGAYTGAWESREGLVRAAHGGTLLLDEVTDLPLELQAKLLHLIESGSYRPIGASREAVSTARIVAASNRDLEEAVECGLFRADLYFRLNVLRICVPPLRERISDVPLLVRDFASRVCGGRAPSFAAEAFDPLMTRDWPGNVRELEHVVLRTLVHNGGGTVRDFDLDLARGARKAGRRFAIASWQLRELLDRSKGQLRPVARELGVSVRTVQRRLKELGVERRAFCEPAGGLQPQRVIPPRAAGGDP